MSRLIDVLARAVAHHEQRALPTRAAFSLTPDPEDVFAIAFIKMVSEELVQAIAYGHPLGEPELITRWNPLSRETGELEPFAQALDAYLARMRAKGALPRIWLPHGSALTLLELLGPIRRRLPRCGRWGGSAEPWPRSPGTRISKPSPSRASCCGCTSPRGRRR
jgi:hypothetical protein